MINCLHMQSLASIRNICTIRSCFSPILPKLFIGLAIRFPPLWRTKLLIIRNWNINTNSQWETFWFVSNNDQRFHLFLTDGRKCCLNLITFKSSALSSLFIWSTIWYGIYTLRAFTYDSNLRLMLISYGTPRDEGKILNQTISFRYNISITRKLKAVLCKLLEFIDCFCIHWERLKPNTSNPKR